MPKKSKWCSRWLCTRISSSSTFWKIKMRVISIKWSVWCRTCEKSTNRGLSSSSKRLAFCTTKTTCWSSDRASCLVGACETLSIAAMTTWLMITIRVAEMTPWWTIWVTTRWTVTLMECVVLTTATSWCSHSQISTRSEVPWSVRRHG